MINMLEKATEDAYKNTYCNKDCKETIFESGPLTQLPKAFKNDKNKALEKFF